jgi:hypothetical protein
MAVPLIAGVVAVQAVSGIMQYWQAEKARGANEKRLKEIEAMFDAIVPPEFDIKVFDDPALANDIPAPALNLDKIDPKLYQSVGQFIPEVAAYVQEADPNLIYATENAQKGREAQLEALERYKKIASGDFDPEFEAKMASASDRARRDAQSRQDSILQDANRRGQMGSGVMMASQMNQGADAMSRQAIESQLAAAESYRNQLGALDRSAMLGGQIRQSEMDEEGKNVGIINDFNERTSRAFQQYLQQRADMANKAKYANWQNDQRIADRNVDIQNAAQLEHVNRYNQGQKTNFDAQQMNRNNRLDLIDRQNRLKQQMYENLIARASGKAGIANSFININNQSAQDKNQAIRGVGDGLTAGALYYYGAQNRQPGQPQPPPSGGAGYPGPSAGFDPRTGQSEQEGFYW